MSHPPRRANGSTPATEPVLGEYAGYLIARTSDEVLARLRAHLLKIGTNEREYALLRVIEARGPLSQQQIGTELRYDRTAMSVLIDAMEDRGLVRRRPHPTDRRAKVIHPTSAGIKLLTKAKPLVRATNDECFEALSEAEYERLHELLIKSYTALSN